MRPPSVDTTTAGRYPDIATRDPRLAAQESLSPDRPAPPRNGSRYRSERSDGPNWASDTSAPASVRLNIACSDIRRKSGTPTGAGSNADRGGVTAGGIRARSP